MELVSHGLPTTQKTHHASQLMPYREYDRRYCWEAQRTTC